MSYSPLHGSTPHNVCLYFKANPDEELSANDIALKFDVPANNVPQILGSAIHCKLLRRARPGIYAGGEALATWVPKPPGSNPRSAKARRPPLDLKAVSIHSRPIPPRNDPTVRDSSYAALYEELKPGQGVDLPGPHMRAFKSWAQRNKQKIVVRRLDDDLYGCWKPAE